MRQARRKHCLRHRPSELSAKPGKPGQSFIWPSGRHSSCRCFDSFSGADRSAIAIKHKALEQSNVDLAEEMTNLIQTQRAYQFKHVPSHLPIKSKV